MAPPNQGVSLNPSAFLYLQQAVGLCNSFREQQSASRAQCEADRNLHGIFDVGGEECAMLRKALIDTDQSIDHALRNASDKATDLENLFYAAEQACRAVSESDDVGAKVISEVQTPKGHPSAHNLDANYVKNLQARATEAAKAQ